MHDRDCGDVHSVARVGLKSANPAFAQNYFIVSARHDVFGGKQQFFESSCNAALEQHGLTHLAQFSEQIEILHIAGANLEDIHVRQHQRNLRNFHDLADHQ